MRGITGLLLFGERLVIISVVLNQILSCAVTVRVVLLLLDESTFGFLLMRTDLLKGSSSNVLGDVLAIFLAI